MGRFIRMGWQTQLRRFFFVRRDENYFMNLTFLTGLILILQYQRIKFVHRLNWLIRCWIFFIKANTSSHRIITVTFKERELKIAPQMDKFN